MQYANLDMIIRRSLLENGLPIHYYFEYLLHSAACIRELNKDTLKIINAADLPINDYNSCDIPSDCMDVLAVGLPSNGRLQFLSKQDNINPLRTHNSSTGVFEPNSTSSNSQGQTLFGFSGAWNWYWNVNDYGEFTGRFYGASGASGAGYTVLKERRQIQFTGSVEGSNVVVLYIGNGQSVNNATQVDWQAFSTIQAYSEWKRSRNANNIHSPEANNYFNSKRLLKIQLDDTTVEDILSSLRGSYRATIKN